MLQLKDWLVKQRAYSQQRGKHCECSEVGRSLIIDEF